MGGVLPRLGQTKRQPSCPVPLRAVVVVWFARRRGVHEVDVDKGPLQTPLPPLAWRLPSHFSHKCFDQFPPFSSLTAAFNILQIHVRYIQHFPEKFLKQRRNTFFKNFSHCIFCCVWGCWVKTEPLGSKQRTRRSSYWNIFKVVFKANVGVEAGMSLRRRGNKKPYVCKIPLVPRGNPKPITMSLAQITSRTAYLRKRARKSACQHVCVENVCINFLKCTPNERNNRKWNMI